MTDPGAASLGDRWLGALERSLTDMLPDFFGDVDWVLRFDRAGLTVTAGDPFGGSSVTVALPPKHATSSPWLLAGELLVQLRRMAEEQGFLRAQGPRRGAS